MNKGLLIGLIVLALVVITIAVVVVIVLLKHSSPTTTSSSPTTTSSSPTTTSSSPTTTSSSPTTTSSSPTTTKPSVSHNKGDTLLAGQNLFVGDYLQSQNGKYTATLGGKTNRLMINNIFVVKGLELNAWNYGYIIRMQPNGNLVIYTEQGALCWAITVNAVNGGDNTFNPNDKNTRAVLQNDGYLVVYNAKNIPWWSTNPV